MSCGPFEELFRPQDSTKATETKILQEPATETFTSSVIRKSTRPAREEKNQHTALRLRKPQSTSSRDPA